MLHPAWKWVSLVAEKPGQSGSISKCPSCLGWSCKFRVIKEGAREKQISEQTTIALVRERERERERVCVCVCVREREREREKEK